MSKKEDNDNYVIIFSDRYSRVMRSGENEFIISGGVYFGSDLQIVRENMDPTFVKTFRVRESDIIVVKPFFKKATKWEEKLVKIRTTVTPELLGVGRLIWRRNA